ncbi:MAG: hypothetical protein UV34_C0019G0003 [Parcubacteria group bacterium GW2011_GWB1_42_6]|nr:MAG: hypothetical protein UV34_C0019G0003 [Parcubacteria group bacterium GW2011_GWB1_42_6]
MEGSHRGRVRSLGKRVYRKVSRVRIPPLPPIYHRGQVRSLGHRLWRGSAKGGKSGFESLPLRSDNEGELRAGSFKLIGDSVLNLFVKDSECCL